jgi:hypothetical protein
MQAAPLFGAPKLRKNGHRRNMAEGILFRNSSCFLPEKTLFFYRGHNEKNLGFTQESV